MKQCRIEVLSKDVDILINEVVNDQMHGNDFFLIETTHLLPQKMIDEVVGDSVVENIFFEKYSLEGFDWVVEVLYKNGVTDNCAKTFVDSLSLFDVSAKVKSGKLYFINGTFSEAQLNNSLSNFIYNPLIHECRIYSQDEFMNGDRFDCALFNDIPSNTSNKVEVIDLNLVDTLNSISETRCLALNTSELEVIRDHFNSSKDSRSLIGLPPSPTDIELECLAQTWSEHCKHKIFNANISFRNLDNNETFRVESIFKTFIRNTTKEIEKSCELDWLISVFHDNAGIVRYDKKVDICFKVETHNSPSALDPYGGALTGILGVNRDILGCGLGARPIANTNVFCFGPWGYFNTIKNSYRPYDLLDSEQILLGVHKGVEHGGNKSGIPTINGAMSFNPSYLGKPLVYVGSIGVMPQELTSGIKTSTKEIEVDDCIVMAGGRVGADGIHGATFSSMDLNEDSPMNAVQIGDPITQKRLSDFLIEARDLQLFRCVTDNGAGGLSSSVGELAELSNGARVELDKVPLKYSGLRPWEILVSESQERMTFAVDPLKIDKFNSLAQKRGVESTVIGKFTNSSRFEVFYHDEVIASLCMEFLHNGLPQMNLNAIWSNKYKANLPFPENIKLNIHKTNIETILSKVISHGNIASKNEWVEQYDQEVGGATSLRPSEDNNYVSPNNAGAISLEDYGGEVNNSIITGVGLCPTLSNLDPELMGMMSVDEAVRNIVAHGADPKQISILDNFCWPDPIKGHNNPDGDYKLGQLVLASRGLSKAALAYSTPLISGKDSMKNDFRGKNASGENIKISINPTLLVSSIGRVDTDKILYPQLSLNSKHVYMIGKNTGGLNGSILSEFYEVEDGLPVCDLAYNKRIYNLIYELNDLNLIKTCCDISEGGLITAISESLFYNKLGLVIEEQLTISELFNESAGRMIVSVSQENLIDFVNELEKSKIHYSKIGTVVNEFSLSVNGEEIDLEMIYKNWSNGLKNYSKDFNYDS
jgi:phosphoribosylformylglycinamidine synthase